MTVEHLDKIAWPVEGMGSGVIYDANGGCITTTRGAFDDCFGSPYLAANFLATLLNAGHAALTGGQSDGWKPIESAPKDGTWVLAMWGGSPLNAAAARVKGSGSWVTMDESDLQTPTHWMPLPALPEPEPEPDPWALLREMVTQFENEVVTSDMVYDRDDAIQRARQALAAHDAREGGE